MEADKKERLMAIAHEIVDSSRGFERSNQGTRYRRRRVMAIEDTDDRFYISAYVENIVQREKKKATENNNFGREFYIQRTT
jgi:hypothetical protein